MRYKVLIGIQLLITACASLGISPKLDFGESSSPKLIGSASQTRSVVTSYKHPKREESKSGDFEGLGVVCVSGGCNLTKSNNSQDSVQTDVVVHVKTSVGLNEDSKSTTVEDVPDVPVVIGTAGTNLEDHKTRTFDQSPLIFTDFGGVSPSFSSSISPSISSSVTPSFVPSYSYSTPALQSDNVYVHKPNLAAEPRVDISVKTSPPANLAVTDDGRYIKDIRYKTNGIEVRVPYFEPSYHNHYFGENPPPQLLWYPTKPALSNTVEYKPKATWKPSFGPIGTSHKHTQGSRNTCFCTNQPISGLQWHPNRRVYQDPGRQIDDKLAPLT